MLTILGLLSLLIGFVGVIYTARGLRGLLMAENAKAVNMLIDPLGRMDLLFSEGHFDLLFDRIYQDFAASLGSVLLLLSLVLSFVANSCGSCAITVNDLSCLILINVLVPILGLALGTCTLPCIRKCVIKHAAKEIEQRAREEIIRGTYDKARMAGLLHNWFRTEVGRDPNLEL